MKIALVSKPEHCRRHKEAIEELGHRVKLMGGNPHQIPATVDAVVLRIRSCSHHASDVAHAWKRANPNKPLIRENGKTGIVRELLCIFPPDRPKEAPVARRIAPVPPRPKLPAPAPVRGRGPAREEKEREVLRAVAAGCRTKEDIAEFLGADVVTTKFYVTDGLREHLKRKSVINMRNRGQASFYVLPEEAGTITVPPYDRPPRPMRKRPLPPGRASSSTTTRAPAREGGFDKARPIDHPILSVDSIQDETALLVVWLREWNIQSMTIHEDGRVRFSSRPTKSREIDVRFEWDD